MKTRYAAVMLIAAAMVGVSCERAAPDRAGRLLTMAGEEAASIPNALDRFTCQLNIADTQLRTDRKADAEKTLLLARDTLTGAKKEDFDDFHRIAAWTAISQLARAAGDRELALKSSDNALAALNDVQPVAQRPQYVLSLAGELANLRGKAEAIELLESGSAWAAEITDTPTRRLALVAFVDRLLSYDAFENARNTLRRDPDAYWRTATFLDLAKGNGYLAAAGASYANGSGTNAGRGGGGAGGAMLSFQQEMKSANTFGKDVRFESVYQQNH